MPETLYSKKNRGSDFKSVWVHGLTNFFALNRENRLLGALKKVIKNKFTLQIKEKLQSVNTKKVEPMNEETRKYLNDFYREDVKKLEKLIDKDLSIWGLY